MEGEPLKNGFKFKTKAFITFSLVFIFFLTADTMVKFLTEQNENPFYYYLEIGGAILILANLITFLTSRKESNITIFLIITGIISFLLSIHKEESIESVICLFSFPFIVAFTREHKSVILWNLPLIFGLILVFLLKEKLFKTFGITGIQSDKKLIELTFGYLAAVVISYFLSKITTDITSEIYNISVKDPLTGLFNRAFALSYLEQEIKDLVRNRNKNRNICVVYIDLDNFKTVNDVFGHSVGDSVLKKVGTIFKTFFRKSDVIARLGGDEFLLIAKNVECESLNRRLEDLRNKIERELKQFNISLSYGISEIPRDTIIAREAIEKADERMYQNKHLKKGKLVSRELPHQELSPD